jgi:hypothetical protein
MHTPLHSTVTLHEQVTSVLARQITAQKTELEERLRRLAISPPRARRPYPKVLPKYQNPKNSRREMVGSWKATALGQDATQIRKKAGAISHRSIGSDTRFDIGR